MSSSSRVSIPVLLFGLVFSVLLPTAGLLAWSFMESKQDAELAAFREVEALAQNASSRIKHLLDEYELSLAHLALRPLVRALDPARCDPLLNELANVDRLLATIVIRDAGGTIICWPAGTPPPPSEVKQFPWFRAGMERGALTVGDAFEGRLSKRWVSILTYPIRDDDGRIMGLVIASIDLLELNQRVMSGFAGVSLAAVYGRDGRFLLRSKDPELWMGQARAADGTMPAGPVVIGRDVIARSSAAAAIPRIFSVVTVAGIGWTVYVGVPEEQVYAGVRAKVEFALALALAVLLLALGLAWRLGAAIVTPIGDLARIARRIADGEGQARVAEEGPREIALVARQFNHMLDIRHEVEESLRASEERWKFAIEGAGEGVWDWDIPLERVQFSRRWKEMIGLAEDEVGDGLEEWSSRVHPGDMPAVMAVLLQHLDGETPNYSSEHRIRCKDGSWKWILDRGLVVARDGEGNPLRMIGTHTDIAERKRAEMLLRARLRLSELGTNANLEALLREALDTAEALTDSSIGFFHFVDADQKQLTLQAWSTNTLRNMCTAEGGGRHYPIDEAGVWVECFHRREPVIHNDYASLAHRKGLPEGHAPITRELVVPILRGGLVTEILGVGNKPSDYTPADVEAVRLVASMVQDIIDRQRTEEALAQSEARYRLVAENVSDVIWVLDVESFRYRYVSPSVERLYGRPNEVHLASEVSETMRKSTYAYLRSVLPERIAEFESGNGRDYLDQFDQVRPDGSTLWTETKSSLQRNPSSGKLEMYGVTRDITERMVQEAALRRGAEEYRGLLATTMDGFFVLDEDLRLVDVNDAYCRMTGYSREELLSMSLPQLEARESTGETAAHVGRIIAMGSDRFETEHLCKDGRVLDIDVSVAWMAASARLLVFVRDISERKRLEEARMRSQKLESLGTLAGGIAHDFNNILSAIRGNAELAVEDVGDDHPAMESLLEVRKAGGRASELVRRITAFGRPREPLHELVDLAVVVDEVLKLLRSTLPAGIALRTQFGAGVPQVLADAAQVHEAVVNLTTNAAYAIGSGVGSIDYVLEAVEPSGDEARRHGLHKGRYARLTVKDSGCGMDEATLARAFDVFFTTKPLGQGSGLGLSMVYGIMRGHGGAVTVESAPGQGSSFHLYFPAAASGQHGGRAIAFALASTPLKGRRILYVDDEEALVSLASRALVRLGHRVTGHTDPRMALEDFRSHASEFDAVVTDLSMPQMSGFDLARQLLAIRPDVPVVLASGYVRAEDEEAARMVGIRAVVHKPATVQELAAVLDKLFLDPVTPPAAAP